MSEQAHSDHADHDHSSHIVPFWLLVTIGGTLMVLTYVTVLVASFDLGAINLVVALMIATFKASLVCLYFMHLRWGNPLNAFIFIFALVCVTLFIFFALLDSTAYQPDIIPGYAPMIEQ